MALLLLIGLSLFVLAAVIVILAVKLHQAEDQNMRLFLDLQTAIQMGKEARRQQEIYEEALDLPHDFVAKEEELLSRAAADDEIASEILCLRFQHDMEQGIRV